MSREQFTLVKQSMDLRDPSRVKLRLRLFRVCLVITAGAVAYVVVDVSSAAIAGAGQLADSVLMGACAILSISMAALALRPGLRPSTLMDLAFVYQVLLCALISLAETMKGVVPGAPIWGISWVCVAMIVFPAVLPYRRFPMLLAALMCALTGPFMYVFSRSVQGREIVFLDALNMYMPNFITLGLAAAIAVYFSSIASDLKTARNMGSYKLVELIATGGMGQVWKAEHATLARPAAVKLILAHNQDPRVDHKKLEERFYREAQATAALSCSHTVTVFDYGVTRSGDQYYVMELLNGVSLQDAVTRFGPMPSERVIFLLLQICQSLAEAHHVGLVHRDIKPANVFLCRKGIMQDFVKVLDFGLVKPDMERTSQLTHDQRLLGTPAYSAPESIEHEAYNSRSDIYSLGCLAYFLLVGRLVFDADNITSLLYQHVSTTPRRPSERTMIPIHLGLERIVMQCLEKDPTARPQDCLELIRRLEELQLETQWSRARAREWWEENVDKASELEGATAPLSRAAVS